MVFLLLTAGRHCGLRRHACRTIASVKRSAAERWRSRRTRGPAWRSCWRDCGSRSSSASSSKYKARNRMVGEPAYRRLYGCALVAIGLGSYFYHATLTFAGQVCDMSGMYLLITFALLYGVARITRIRTGVAMAAYVVWQSSPAGLSDGLPRPQTVCICGVGAGRVGYRSTVIGGHPAQRLRAGGCGARRARWRWLSWYGCWILQEQFVNRRVCCKGMHCGMYSARWRDGVCTAITSPKQYLGKVQPVASVALHTYGRKLSGSERTEVKCYYQTERVTYAA